MRFFRNLQFAQVKQTAGKTVVALAFMLVMLGSMFSVSAFAQIPSAFAKPTVRVHAVQSIPKAGCFPSNAIWTWVSSSEVFQAWIALDTTPNKHVNFHVQYYCGGDIRNYHITYAGNGLFKSYDFVTGVTKTYGNSGIYVCDSLSVASSEQATDAGNTLPSAYGKDLTNQSVYPLYEAMNELMGGICP